MKKTMNITVREKTLSAVLAAAVSAAAMAQVDYRVIPLPDSIAIGQEGENYRLVSGSVVSYPGDDTVMETNARLLCDYLGETAGLSLTARADAGPEAAITLRTGLAADNEEAYTLTVDSRGVTITGASGQGVFRGGQTLRKAIGTLEGDTISLPFATIADQPRFAYRGAHIDCSRHFFPLSFLKKYVDILALHGCNNLHWHLTDDQGWRFEVKAMPELTGEGSARRETVIGPNCGIYDGQEYGGGLYYTQEQCRELVSYAAERHINIVPEIDLPGHMVAALHAHPELGCTGGPYEVWTEWGVSADILCAGNSATLPFLKTVLAELADVFPSRLIHIGGDESPRTRWERCPLCQAKKTELGLDSEAGLQTYINRELEEFLRERGRTVVCWDEVLEGGAGPDATVMSWRGQDKGLEAAKRHHDVIMTPTSHCYFDYYQLRNRASQPLAIGGYLPVSKVYSLEPVPAGLSPEEERHILGAQCNLWSEFITAPQQMEYMLLPRLAAMSEVQWTQPRHKDFGAFLTRLQTMTQLYDKLGFKHCPIAE